MHTNTHLIGVIFLKRPLFIALTLTILSIFTACSNKDFNQANNEIPTKQAVYSSTDKDVLSEEKTDLTIDTNYDYWSAKLTDTISIYVRKNGKNEKKVYVENNNIVSEFSWDYNLDYGEPICQIQKNSDGKELLYIVLPTLPVEPMIIDELYQSKICGKLHILDLETLIEEPEWQVIPKINNLLSIHSGVKNVYDLTLDVSGYQYCYNFKSVENLNSFQYKKSFLVFNGSIGFSSYSDGIYANEQVGIKFGDKLIWLGVIQINVNKEEPFENDTTLGNRNGMNFKFYGNYNIRYSPTYKRSPHLTGAFLQNINRVTRTIDADLCTFVEKDTYIDTENPEVAFKTLKISKKVKIIGWDLEGMGTVYLSYDEFARLIDAGYFNNKAVSLNIKNGVITELYEIINP